jgi:DNA replication licensing factor MCM6
MGCISFRFGNLSEPYYEAEIEAMKASESTTMFIDFSHVMLFNNLLQKAISEEYLRFLFFFKQIKNI